MAKPPKHRKPRKSDGSRMVLGNNRDTQGVRRCRWCTNPVPPPKLTFCGPPCVHEWKLRTQASYRKLVVDHRDKGICAICGIDTYAQQQHYKKLYASCSDAYGRYWSKSSAAWPVGFGDLVREAMFDGISVAKLFTLLERATPYDIDHHIPLIENGDHGLENLRTLCLGCHVRETTALKARRSTNRM